jgi:hypothetical protein
LTILSSGREIGFQISYLKKGFMKILFSGKSRFPFRWLLVLIIALSSCSSFTDEKIKTSTNLEIGDETVVATQTIPSSGGTVEVNAAGSEIDGLEIVVPSNCYSGTRTFKISTAPITSYTLGQYFNPITPLIQIENGGGYADGIMEITIPVTIPDGQIPLGFYYDEINGTLEAIPVKDYTSKSITLLTRHFMPVSELSSTDETLKSGGIKVDPTANLVISSISESILKGKPIISSGYKVGTDDWEFTNYGSYIADGGHCAGQNMCTMWYYFEKKMKGEDNLFGRFSTVPSLWQDNAIGYRFCSVVHNDLEWDGKVSTFFSEYIDKNQGLDKLKLYSIAGAMLTTGEPQGIGIYRQTGTNTNGSPKYGGHDLICYQVAINDGKLYISDPNKPGVEQFIEFKNNKFEPYIAKLNGNAASNPYPFVTWYAKTAYIEWDKIGKRYSELLDSTIGNKAPNTFPAYTIWVKGKADSELKNGYTTNSDTLRCMVASDGTNRGFNIGGKWYIWLDMFDVKGANIGIWDNKGTGTVILKPGLNKIGFYVYSLKTGVTDGNGNYTPLFIDFKWFTINCSKLEIVPNPITGSPGDEITLTASTGGTAPQSAKYVWNFGDGTSDVTVTSDSTVIHKFSNEGNYTVSVKLYNNSTNILVSQATAVANIGSGILSKLQKCKYVSVYLTGVMTVNLGFSIYEIPMISSSPVASEPTNTYPLKWSGTSFTTTYNNEGGGTQDVGTRSGTISGSLSADGLIVETLTANQTILRFFVDPKGTTTTEESISLKNVPFDGTYNINEQFYKVVGFSIGQSLTSVSYQWETNWDDGTHSDPEYLTNVDYENANLQVVFSGSN